MIAKLFTSFKKTPLLALLNSKRLEISPKNGWRDRVLARRSFSEVGAGEPMTSFPNWRCILEIARTEFGRASHGSEWAGGSRTIASGELRDRRHERRSREHSKLPKNLKTNRLEPYFERAKEIFS